MKKEIKIKDEILRYLGYRGQKIDNTIDKMIDRTIKEIKKIVRERYIYKEFNIKNDKEGLYLKNTNLYLPGNDIKEHLSESKTCILMAATLGNDLDRRIRYYQKSDMTKALILDAAGTAFIEKLCNEICKKIEISLEKKNKKITNRYSPGYGDLPIELQNDFLRTLDSQRLIGLTGSSNSILIPRKSITAIVGIIDRDGTKIKTTAGLVTALKPVIFQGRIIFVIIKERLKDEVLVFDGAMGTMIQNIGLKIGELPEAFNINSPEKIVDIHRKYIKAGANIITTNTFGANEIKLKDTPYKMEELIQRAVENAKKARGHKEIYIALDMGPIGELLEPMGTLSFESAYNIYKRQVVQGVKNGVDLILIETMTDLYEVKAAVLAAKENSDLPVFVTMSYEEDGRTFTGCNIKSMVIVLEGLGVDALGLNCSLGPKEIEPLVDEILTISNTPLIVQANAGLPQVVNGETIFNIGPDEFAEYGASFIKKGVKIIGGCCGTTDKHIEALKDAVKNITSSKKNIKTIDAVCTPTRVVTLDKLRVVGERINPTGKEEFKQAFEKGNLDYVLKEAIAQVNVGAEILDINVGLPEINEEETMVKVIKEIQSILDVPLQIDSTNPKVIESALRIYNGKAIVNSVNGEDKVLDSILPIVKKYGASVIGLTLDEKGIPKGIMERFDIAKKIMARAKDYGIDKKDIIIDTLTLTAGAQQEDVKETLKAISLVKEELGVKTTLGVSNVSFGLPNRELINKTFLAAGIFAGLDLPIVDPLNKDIMDTIKASKVLWNQDIGAVDYLESHKDAKITKNIIKEDLDSKDLFQIILDGMKEEAKKATIKLLEDREPLDIVNECITPALDLVGENYEKGHIFLPQLIRSAETVKSSFEIIKTKISQDSAENISKGKIMLATVDGDIHDIGKNIVGVLLESYNYEIIDLGKNVSKERIVEAAIKNDIKLVGLSALMTTTVKSMEETIGNLKNTGLDLKIMVGGAVLNKEYSKIINADYYAKDAKEGIEIARKVLG